MGHRATRLFSHYLIFIPADRYENMLESLGVASAIEGSVPSTLLVALKNLSLLP